MTEKKRKINVNDEKSFSFTLDLLLFLYQLSFRVRKTINYEIQNKSYLFFFLFPLYPNVFLNNRKKKHAICLKFSYFNLYSRPNLKITHVNSRHLFQFPNVKTSTETMVIKFSFSFFSKIYNSMSKYI